MTAYPYGHWQTKAPGENLDYDFDFTDQLAGDTISTATYSISPSGLTQGATSLNAGSTIAKVWLSGGTSGVRYLITCHVVTSGARTLERTMSLPVGPR